MPRGAEAGVGVSARAPADPKHGSSQLLPPPPPWDLLLSFSLVLEAELNYGYFYVH